MESMPDLDVVIDHMADCPIDQPQELNKLLALARYPKRVRENLSHLVDFQTAVSLVGRPRVCETALRGLWPASV